MFQIKVLENKRFKEQCKVPNQKYRSKVLRLFEGDNACRKNMKGF